MSVRACARARGATLCARAAPPPSLLPQAVEPADGTARPPEEGAMAGQGRVGFLGLGIMVRGSRAPARARAHE